MVTKAGTIFTLADARKIDRIEQTYESDGVAKHDQATDVLRGVAETLRSGRVEPPRQIAADWFPNHLEIEQAIAYGKRITRPGIHKIGVISDRSLLLGSTVPGLSSPFFIHSGRVQTAETPIARSVVADRGLAIAALGRTYRFCWVALSTFGLLWGVLTAMSFGSEIGISKPAAVFGLFAYLGLVSTLFVAGRELKPSVKKL